MASNEYMNIYITFGPYVYVECCLVSRCPCHSDDLTLIHDRFDLEMQFLSGALFPLVKVRTSNA